jgi:hypothetical protein
VHVRLGSLDGRRVWVRGRVVRAPHEPREGVAVTVDCDDGFRRYVEPARLRPELLLVRGGKP